MVTFESQLIKLSDMELVGALTSVFMDIDLFQNCSAKFFSYTSRPGS